MENWQQIIVWVVGGLAIGFAVAGFVKSRTGKAYGKFWLLNIIGAFVWGDAIIFGPFWAVASVIVIWMQSWWLFEIIFLCFWLVRSVGETIYWLNQQFSSVIREKPEKMLLHRFVKSNAVWFLMQIWWQCISVATLVLLILLLKS